MGTNLGGGERSRAAQEGFTLLEVLFASLLVASVGLVALGVLGAAAHGVSRSQPRDRALVEADNARVDLQAKSMYDAAALGAISNASWTVTPAPRHGTANVAFVGETVPLVLQLIAGAHDARGLRVTIRYAYPQARGSNLEAATGSIVATLAQAAPDPGACPTPLRGAVC